jgi:hypothetical protein
MRRAAPIANVVPSLCQLARLLCLMSLASAPLLTASEACGQVPAAHVSISPLIGKRIRITRSSDPRSRLEGRLLAMTGDSIAVGTALGDAPLVIALGPDARLEAWQRGSGAEAVSAVLGTAGAVAGARYYVHWCRDNPDPCAEDLSYKHDDDDCDDDDTCGSSNMSFLSFTVLGGMLAGAALGYAIVPPRWQPVDRPFRVSVVPAGGGRVLVGASYAFYARPRP